MPHNNMLRGEILRSIRMEVDEYYSFGWFPYIRKPSFGHFRKVTDKGYCFVDEDGNRMLRRLYYPAKKPGQENAFFFSTFMYVLKVKKK